MVRYAAIPSRPILGSLTFVIAFALPVAAAADARVSESYGKLPLHFEANRGQTHQNVRFLSRGPGYSLYLTAGEAVLVLAKPNSDGKLPKQGAQAEPKAQVEAQAAPVALRMSLVGANRKPLVSGLEELPGKANYFIGKDPAKWRTNVPTYAKVHYREVYPGIDLLYYGNQRQLEYDFVVAPGADPKKIVLGFKGTDKLEINAQGDLVLHAPGGAIRQRKPVIYQEIDGVRQEIAGSYVRKGASRIGFKVAAYDASRPLIIDPVLAYSTYLGGSGQDLAQAIAVDGGGNAYVTGRTNSINFPTTTGAFQTAPGGTDAFVAKVNPSGTGLVYSTFLGGGTSFEHGSGIAVDAAGNAYIAGLTFSTDFPTTPGAFQRALAGDHDAFVTKLNPTGSALVYSTYLGGSGGDSGEGIAVDASGNAYVMGSTTSSNFPTAPGAFETSGPGSFVTKLNPAGSALVYSTYFAKGAIFGIAVDAGGNAYVTGDTGWPDFPTTPGAFQPTFGGGFSDGFVTKLNPTGSALVYSTYLGGSGSDRASGIAVDATGNVFVTGDTTSANFPTSSGAFQPVFSGGSSGTPFDPTDAFVTKLDPTGSGPVYSTYLGGSSSADFGVGIAVDSSGNAYVTGFTYSTDFPTTRGAFQPIHGGWIDAFVTKLDPTGSALVYSSFLGGFDTDRSFGIAVDINGNAYVTGFTLATNFPITPGAFQPAHGGGSGGPSGSLDAFVAKIVDDASPVPDTPPTFRSATSGTLGTLVGFRAASSAATTTGTLAIARPAGTVENDVMIAAIGVRPAGAFLTPPAGWILVRRVNNFSGISSSLVVYRKLAGAAEADSYSWTLGGSTHAAGGIQSFFGVDTANPIDVENGRTTGWSLSHPTPSVSTTVANTVIVTAHTFPSAAGWTPPAGMTEGFDIAAPAPPNSTGQAIEANWAQQAAAGATGTKTATASNDADGGNTHILALRRSVSTLFIGRPAGAAANDVMIASIGIRPSSATITPPAGWTRVRRIDNASPNSNSLAVYRKVAGAAEPASYAWGVNSASFAVGGIQAFSNVDTANPIDVESGQATPSALSHSTPSVTTTVANTMVVTSHTFSTATSWTPPAGMTEGFDIATPAPPPGGGQALEGNWVPQAAAGTTGVKTATSAAAAGAEDVGNTHILALRPAASQPSLLAVVGEWSGPVSLPIVPIHMHLLPDGNVLAWGNPATPPRDGRAQERVWNPTLAQPVFQEVHNPFVDVYCGGHSYLADGRLLLTGGHIDSFVGSDATTVFDFRTRTWSNGPRMSAARWYPTNTTLPNGEVVVVSGSIDSETNVNTLPEVWNAATGSRPLTGAQLALSLYPWMHLAPNGKLFNSGPGQTTRYLDPGGTGGWTTVAFTNFGDRHQYEGTSVMYEPGKVLILGGGNPATASAEVINLNDASPRWLYTNSMTYARRYPNATILPDGKVLVTGGSSSSDFSDPRGAVHDAEMWDPATGSWSTLAAMRVRRLYHSTAVLLPDGRVLTAGGGANGDFNFYDAEYYSPPYLFNGARPTIASAPESAGYGATFTVGTPDAADITQATLVGLSSSTHEFNQNQRFVRLVFSTTADGTGLNVTVPSNPNLAPPGYYMLFILNRAGVPSIAKMVRIASS